MILVIRATAAAIINHLWEGPCPGRVVIEHRFDVWESQCSVRGRGWRTTYVVGCGVRLKS